MKLKLFPIALLLLFAWAAAPPALAQKQPKPAGQMDFGVKMAKQGLWSEALFRFLQAEKLGDQRVAVYNNIAVAYEALGVFDKAQEYYKKAMEADSTNPGLRRNYSRFVEFYQSYKPDNESSGEEGEEPESSAGSGSP